MDMSSEYYSSRKKAHIINHLHENRVYFPYWRPSKKHITYPMQDHATTNKLITERINLFIDLQKLTILEPSDI